MQPSPARPATVATIAALLLLTGCGRNQPAPTEAEKRADVTVTLEPAKALAVPRTIRVVGTVYGEEEVAIAAKVPGRVSEIAKDMGDRVTPQDVLLKIDTTDYDLAVRQKELAVSELLAKLNTQKMPGTDFDFETIPNIERGRLQAQSAKDKYERARQLHDQTPPLISDQEFADQKTAYNVARIAYAVELMGARSTLAEAQARQFEADIARQRRDDATVRAAVASVSTAGSDTMPRSYAVSSRIASVGAYVKEGDVMMRLVADERVKLRAMVPERFISAIKQGQRAAVSVDAFADTFEGTVTRINPQIDSANRAFQIEILVQNTDHRLRPGSFARAQVFSRTDEGVVFVPQDAVVTFAGTTRIYSVEQGKAVAIDIETGERRGDLVEITRGSVKAGQPVVVSGVTKLAPGVAVSVKPSSPTSQPQTPAAESAESAPSGAKP
jgi:RND family efflux transporter MFP subunit